MESSSKATCKVGIAGVGTVGGAIRATCEGVALLVCWDELPEREENVLRMGETDLVFVCVPTPTSGVKQDLGPLHDVLLQLEEQDYTGVVVVKSTVLPGTMDELNLSYGGLRLVHSPEFLSERSAPSDYRTQATILLSGLPTDLCVVAEFIGATLGATFPRMYFSPHYRATEYAKYIHNCALAVQLSFLNEVYDDVDDPEVFGTAVDMASHLGNITGCHLVPGPDGRRGWGGKCFPKDTLAFLRSAERDMPTLRGAIDTNFRLRPEEMKKL